MDGFWTPYAQDAKRVVAVRYYAAATPLELVNGTAAGSSPGPVDLSRYATSVRQSANEASVSLSWHHELDGTAQPNPGAIIEILLDGESLWWGIIEAVNDYRLQTGQRSLTIVARSRDASPFWREVRRVTDVYPPATPLAYIERQIAYSLGLTDLEILLPATSGYTVHSNTQLADLTAWAMLEQLFQPVGYQPFIDAKGRLKTISRDTTRAADVVLTEDRIVAVTGSRTRAPTNVVRVNWLDPNLTRVEQQNQPLGNATITAGFFVDRVKQDIFFSSDRTQRAANTYLVIKQSANAGLIPVCDEDYEQKTLTSGRIVLTNTYYAATLATLSLAEQLALSRVVDGVAVYVTVPYGRVLQMQAQVTLLLAMMSIGTGVYEVHGTPYDYVHARNTTEAYECTAREWETNVTEIENDFVTTEDAAQAFAVRELSYLIRAANSYNVTIVDDPRIEPGDILELHDGTRLYVTGYSRDLSRDAPAVLDLQGFKV